MHRFALSALLLATHCLITADANARPLPDGGTGSFVLDAEAVGTFAPTDFAPNAILPWHNGGIVNIGQNFACLSDPPILEIRTQGYAGFSLRPPNFTPAVGEIFYTHLVLSHPGNPCAGSAVGLEMLLPNGVQPATSAANPAFCFAVLPASPSFPNARLHNFALDSEYGCPQVFPQGLEGLRIVPPNGGFGGSGAWGMHRGFFIELLIPLRASQPQFGSQSIRFRVNPDIGVVGYPSIPLQVNNEVVFRDSMEDDLLTLDICGITPRPQGCG